MRPGNSGFQLCSVSVRDANGKISPRINISEEIIIEIEYEVIQEGAQAQFSLVLFDAKGICVFSSLSNTVENAYHGKLLRKGFYRTVCHLYGNLLNEERYRVSIIGTSGYWSDGFRADYVLAFDTLDDGVLKRDYSGHYDGVIRPKLAWRTTLVQHPSDDRVQ
jgi:lipopolysaccharide transport system ATP-binding protein